MKKTLYITDLDKTLLKNDATISRFSLDTLNSLMERGAIISYATARSYVTASKVTKGLHPKNPVVIYNGTFIYDADKNERIFSNAFSKKESESILSYILENKVYPMVYAFIDGVEKYSYDKEHVGPELDKFITSHKDDIRDNPVNGEALFSGEIFHFTCIDKKERLEPLYEELKKSYQCVLYKDPYTNEWWLEIHPNGATKANAVKELARILGCEKIVCFGDGKNDISMFENADECYAVENADNELKAIATAVIGSNENDGVANWLIQNIKNS